ncbi:T9SS type A sorting domain-containing protein [Lewinella sp. IMCC34183]|uniref:T9SS type A sorting domain-containing protein n=1 Tax=Lewinella sp. IMCC34183 TaxID=2248762 RepID=UPI000E2879CC|nr:T9SS type A sorting domain-containing protein [Lewinella sp. IMCC34183]
MTQTITPALAGGRIATTWLVGWLFFSLLPLSYPLSAQTCDPNAPTYYRQNGSGSAALVSLEAELYTARKASRKSGHAANVTWTTYADPAASNAAYINIPTTNQDAMDPDDLGADVSYDIAFTQTGTYHMWIRIIAPDNDARSFHLLLDGAVVMDDLETSDGFTTWRWEKIAATVPIGSAGTHRLTIRHREDGFRMDKIVLSTFSNYNPTGYGPDATAVRTYAPIAAVADPITYHVDHHTGHGFAVVEAEHPSSKVYGIGNLACLNWTEAIRADASNDSTTQVNSTGRIATPATIWGSPRIEYAIATDRTEDLYLHLRHRGTTGNSSVQVSVNGGTRKYFDLANTTDYVWESIALGTVSPRTDGTFLLSLLMHEDGTPVDKILVTTDPDYTPTDKGPLETILNNDELVYFQEDSPGFPVELPLEAPSQRLGGFYVFSGMGWSNVEDAGAEGGQFATVNDPLTGWVEATGALTSLAPSLEYEIEFIESGPHYIYTQHNATSDLRNSYAYYLDGTKLGTHEVPVEEPGTWNFARNAPMINIPSAGRHTFAMNMQESGGRFDHVVISQQPSGSALQLPVELITFTGDARPGYNELTWTTAREENTYLHVLERSPDGVHDWTTVGNVPAAGDSDDLRQYASRDARVVPMAYYRLKTVDLDGSESLSGVISLSRQAESVHLSVYPNPATELAVLQFEHPGNADVRLEIVSLSGRIVATQSYPTTAGENRVELPLEQLSSGTYLVTAVIAGQRHTRQLVVN